MANVTVTIPHAMAHLARGRTTFRLSAGNVVESIEALDREHPGLKGRFLNAENVPWDYINIYVNDEEASTPDALGTPLADGDKVTIVPALAGG